MTVIVISDMIDYTIEAVCTFKTIWVFSSVSREDLNNFVITDSPSVDTHQRISAGVFCPSAVVSYLEFKFDYCHEKASTDYVIFPVLPYDSTLTSAFWMETHRLRRALNDEDSSEPEFTVGGVHRQTLTLQSDCAIRLRIMLLLMSKVRRNWQGNGTFPCHLLLFTNLVDRMGLNTSL